MRAVLPVVMLLLFFISPCMGTSCFVVKIVHIIDREYVPVHHSVNMKEGDHSCNTTLGHVGRRLTG